MAILLDTGRPVPANVMAFPGDMVRRPGVAPVRPLGPDAASGTNVVAFGSWTRKTSGRSRKA
jgi:hypothetical protein